MADMETQKRSKHILCFPFQLAETVLGKKTGQLCLSRFKFHCVKRLFIMQLQRELKRGGGGGGRGDEDRMSHPLLWYQDMKETSITSHSLETAWRCNPHSLSHYFIVMRTPVRDSSEAALCFRGHLLAAA